MNWVVDLGNVHRLFVGFTITVFLIGFPSTLWAEEVDRDELFLQLESTREYATKSLRLEGTVTQKNMTNNVLREKRDEFVYECFGDGVVKMQYDYQELIEDGLALETPGVYISLFTLEWMATYVPKSNAVIINPAQNMDSSSSHNKFYREGGLIPSHMIELKLHVVSVEETHIGEDAIIRVVTSRRKEGGRHVTAIWNVLPEKGYCLKSSYIFFDGRLALTKRFDHYKELDDGYWFPHQVSIFNFSKAEQHPALDTTIIEVDWGKLDDFDLTTIEAWNSHNETVQFDQVEYFKEGSTAEFDFMLPAGTEVVDWRSASDVSMLLRMVVDEETRMTDAADEIATNVLGRRVMATLEKEKSLLWLPLIPIVVILLAFLIRKRLSKSRRAAALED